MSKQKEVEAAVAALDLDNNKYQLHFQSSMGPIRLELWPEVAPGHCANILGLAKSGFYDGLTFHRVISGFVIQGGCPEGSGRGGPGYQIRAEFNDRKHEPGVLSMARSQDPHSAGSQFFLCLGTVTGLDNQYTAFGKTADEESLKTVMAIGDVATDPNDFPIEKVVIESATVVPVE